MFKNRIVILLLASLIYLHSWSQSEIPVIQAIELEGLSAGKIHKLWLQLGMDTYQQPIVVPVLIAKGREKGTVLGLTAAIHGNELNGIPVIQGVFKQLNPQSLKGTLIGVPGINPLSLFSKKRRFVDQEDLNRVFPGKPDGNKSEQFSFQILHKIINHLDFHVDMHTASFGRVNSYYGRGNIEDDTLRSMLRLQKTDIILASKGKPSFGSSSGQTLRAAAISRGVKSITIEYGNPQVYQSELINKGIVGIQNLMMWLGMTAGEFEMPDTSLICSKSYWLYTDQGGFLEVGVELNQLLNKGDQIGILKDPFGDILKKYYAPEDGIVIGKNADPVVMSGGRIIHLGILKPPNEP